MESSLWLSVGQRPVFPSRVCRGQAAATLSSRAGSRGASGHLALSPRGAEPSRGLQETAVP